MSEARPGTSYTPTRPRYAAMPRYTAMALAAIGALTALRLALIALERAGLYPDEAQYWFWAQHLALGYYSKPPLVAWVIRLSTAILGDGEFGVRAAAPLVHAATALIVYAIGTRLYDRRIGFWAALGYATLPGTSLSSFIISTDAVLLPCWAAALYALVRAREPGEQRWWLVAGLAAGLGLLAKYAMAYWIVSALIFTLAIRTERRHLPRLLGTIAIAVLIYLPNLWWNWHNGFVSYLHLRDNADVSGPLFHPKMLAEFLISQFGVFGPVLFAILIAIAARPRALADPRARLLAFFTFPTLVFMLAVSLTSRAQPNWAAPVYVSAVILVAAWALNRDWRRTLGVGIALNLILALGLFGAAGAAAAFDWPARYDPLHRLRGWHKLGDAVGEALAAHPGLTLLADDRELLASLIYNVHPHPLDAVIWSPIPGIKDQWALTNNLSKHGGGSFLAVTVHNLVDQMRPLFDELTPAGEITITPGPDGTRTYYLYVARGYKGG